MVLSSIRIRVGQVNSRPSHRNLLQIFERDLAPGEAIDIEPGAWLWKDPSVTMQTINIIQSSSGGGGSGLAGGKSHGLGGFLSKVRTEIAYVSQGDLGQS